MPAPALHGVPLSSAPSDQVPHSGTPQNPDAGHGLPCTFHRACVRREVSGVEKLGVKVSRVILLMMHAPQMPTLLWISWIHSGGGMAELRSRSTSSLVITTSAQELREVKNRGN